MHKEIPAPKFKELEFSASSRMAAAQLNTVRNQIPALEVEINQTTSWLHRIMQTTGWWDQSPTLEAVSSHVTNSSSISAKCQLALHDRSFLSNVVVCSMRFKRVCLVQSDSFSLRLSAEYLTTTECEILEHTSVQCMRGVPCGFEVVCVSTSPTQNELEKHWTWPFKVG